MADLVIANRSDIVAVANAVRNKTGATGGMTLPQMASKVSGITTTTTPTISVSSGGLITATAGDKTATKQLTTKAATTYTPKTSNQTISSGTYLTGTQTIKGDSNLVAGNIKSGVSIFGVTGSFESGGGELKTCSIVVDSYSRPVLLTRYKDGAVVITETEETDTLTYDDVICGTPIVCLSSATGYTCENTTFTRCDYRLNLCYFTAPQELNGIAHVWYTDELVEEEIPEL